MCGSCVPKVHALPHHALPHHLLEGRHRAANVLLIVRDRIGKHWGRGEETVAIVRSQNLNEGRIVTYISGKLFNSKQCLRFDSLDIPPTKFNSISRRRYTVGFAIISFTTACSQANRTGIS